MRKASVPLARAVSRAVHIRIPVYETQSVLLGLSSGRTLWAVGADRCRLALLALMALLVRPATAFPDGTLPRRRICQYLDRGANALAQGGKQRTAPA